MVKKIFDKAFIFIILALLYAPIVMIIVFSFSNTSNFTFPHGFTLDAYRSILNSSQTPALLSALKNTLIIASVSSVAATILGSVSAIGIFNLRKRMRKVVENVNQLPIINSEIVMAVSLMLSCNFCFPRLCPTYHRPYILLHALCGFVGNARLIQMDPKFTKPLWIWALLPPKRWSK